MGGRIISDNRQVPKCRRRGRGPSNFKQVRCGVQLKALRGGTCLTAKCKRGLCARARARVCATGFCVARACSAGDSTQRTRRPHPAAQLALPWLLHPLACPRIPPPPVGVVAQGKITEEAGGPGNMAADLTAIIQLAHTQEANESAAAEELESCIGQCEAAAGSRGADNYEMGNIQAPVAPSPAGTGQRGASVPPPQQPRAVAAAAVAPAPTPAPAPALEVSI